MLHLAGPLQLRPFAMSDAGAVEPWLSGPGLSMPGGLLRREWPQRLLADAHITARVAESGGRPVGFLRLDCGPDRIAELTLVVAPECRRLGHGSAMFKAALRLSRSMGIRRVIAWIDVRNQPALDFFAQQGLVHDGLVGERLRMCYFVHAGDHQPPLDIEA